MHVHIIKELNVVSGPAEGTALQERLISRTQDRQWRKEKSTVATWLSKKYHRSAIICTPSTGTSPLAFSQDRPRSQQSVPRSTWRYQDICVHIFMVCGCAECQTVCNVATFDPYRAPRRHVRSVGFSQCTPPCVRRCQIWLLQCCPVLWLQRCQTYGTNVVNSPV